MKQSFLFFLALFIGFIILVHLVVAALVFVITHYVVPQYHLPFTPIWEWASHIIIVMVILIHLLRVKTKQKIAARLAKQWDITLKDACHVLYILGLIEKHPLEELAQWDPEDYIFYMLTTYESPKGSHRHKCKKCDTVWEHSDDCVNNKKMHTCPNCKKVQWFKYFGAEPPQFLYIPSK